MTVDESRTYVGFTHPTFTPVPTVSDPRYVSARESDPQLVAFAALCDRVAASYDPARLSPKIRADLSRIAHYGGYVPILDNVRQTYSARTRPTKLAPIVEIPPRRGFVKIRP